MISNNNGSPPRRNTPLIGLAAVCCVFSIIASSVCPIVLNLGMNNNNTPLDLGSTNNNNTYSTTVPPDTRRRLGWFGISNLIKDPQTTAQKQQTVGDKQALLVLPNILFLGAQKSGSSSISSWLFKGGICNAEIISPEVEPSYYAKEVHFFDKIPRYREGPKFYSRRFEHCINEEFIMDATPETLLFPDRVFDLYSTSGAHVLPNLKLMVVLREPIARELSFYNHFTYHRAEEGLGVPSFEEHVSSRLISELSDPDFPSTSFYVDHIKRFALLFGRDKLLVLSYDEVKTDPKGALWRIKTFLGRDFPGDLGITNTHDNPNKLREVPSVARQMLEPIFEAKNQELYEFLDANPGPSVEQRPFPHFHVE